MNPKIKYSKHKDIYKLKIHEVTIIRVNPESYKMVVRVPGGWIYYHESENVSGVFVPYNNEFQK